MDWFKKHIDSIVVIATVVGSVVWLNDKFNTRLNKIEQDLAVIKTALIMKNIMPPEFASNSTLKNSDK